MPMDSGQATDSDDTMGSDSDYYSEETQVTVDVKPSHTAPLRMANRSPEYTASWIKVLHRRLLGYIAATGGRP